MENLALHSFLRWKMIILPILITSLIHFSSKGWENVLFWTSVFWRCRIDWTYLQRGCASHCPFLRGSKCGSRPPLQSSARHVQLCNASVDPCWQLSCSLFPCSLNRIYRDWSNQNKVTKVTKTKQRVHYVVITTRKKKKEEKKRQLLLPAG